MLNYDEIINNPHMQKQIEVIKGSDFSVTLLSNASTGFSWNENAVIADAGIVQQIKHEATGSGSNVPGAAGAEKWNFKALKQGATTVHLEYGRPWTGGEKGVWTFDLAVTVK
jgi:predicted secreted protein